MPSKRAPARRARPTGSRRDGGQQDPRGAQAWVAGSGEARSERGSTARQELLAAARVVFSRMGYGGTRLLDIAEEAGVTRTAVYHYFRSRRDIFIEIGRTATREFNVVLEVARSVPDQWEREDLAPLIAAHLAWLEHNGVIQTTWVQATWDDVELRAVGLEAEQRYFTAMGEQLRRLRGGAPDVDPAHEGVAFLGMIERVWQFSRHGGTALDQPTMEHLLLIEATALLRRPPAHD